ncbi:hypothetical protein HY008_03195 [Candidatus Woesebacteria bacterium]|nr:hypothetical protein [Candidatus Woesebacteria bacterium]
MTERIKDLFKKKEEEIRLAKEEIRKRDLEDKRKLQEECDRSRTLIEKSGVMNILKELNREVLNGKGNFKMNTRVCKYVSRSGTTGDGTDWEDVDNTGGTIVELRWNTTRNRQNDSCIVVSASSSFISIYGKHYKKDYSPLTDPYVRVVVVSPYLTVDGGRYFIELSDDEVKKYYEEEIAKAYLNATSE